MAKQPEYEQYQSNEPLEYSQLSFDSVETQENREVTLENCFVVSRPTSTKNGKNREWQCGLYAPPDIFNQDRDEIIKAHATTYADTAKQLRLLPGDRVSITGRLSQQVLELVGGEKKIVNYLAVSDIQVLSRIKRENLTVYERKRGR